LAEMQIHCEILQELSAWF